MIAWYLWGWVALLWLLGAYLLRFLLDAISQLPNAWVLEHLEGWRETGGSGRWMVAFCWPLLALILLLSAFCDKRE